MASYEECMCQAHECVRLAGLTDDRVVRDQIIEVAKNSIRAAVRAESEARVIEFPGRLTFKVPNPLLPPASPQATQGSSS
jgi:hypothetical protein